MTRPLFGKTAAALALCGALSGLPLAGYAHHAEAEYDTSQPVAMNGTVKSFSMGNPHSWLTLTVSDPQSGNTDWLLEGNSVTLLKRYGWTQASVKPGDQIKVTMAPHHDGIKRGEIIQVQTASGATLTSAMVEP